MKPQVYKTKPTMWAPIAKMLLKYNMLSVLNLIRNKVVAISYLNNEVAFTTKVETIIHKLHEVQSR